MPDRVYNTLDGLQVVLEEETWLKHIQSRHSEVTELEVAEALQDPARICSHTSRQSRRIYQGQPRATGFFRGSFPLIVVALIDAYNGRVVTAYLERLPYRGQQLWPPLTGS